MSRLVILRHTGAARGPHWDLMLEVGDVLWTWALHGLPCPGSQLRGERIADHRPAYLTYEGPVSRNGGHVVRWFASDFEWQTQTEDRIEVQLAGDGGQLQLDRIDASGPWWHVRWIPSAPGGRG